MNFSLTVPRLFLAGATLAFLATAPVSAQSGKSDKSSKSGKTTGEWFDPTDWFDANNANTKVSGSDKYGVYEYDYAYGLGEGFNYSVWSTYERWDPKNNNARYWDKQDWADTTNRLSRPSGKPVDFEIHADASRKQRDSGSPKKGSADNQLQEGRKQVAHLTGTIEGLRNVELTRESGATNTYTLAKVRLDRKDSTVVALGRAAQVQDLNLKKGDEIESVGRRGTIDGNDVFVAHRLKAGNRTIDAIPTIRLAEQSSKRSAAKSDKDKDQETITGTVEQIKKAAGKNDSTLVELKQRNGRSTTVDFGPAASLQQINLAEGDNITVRGRTQERGDRKLLIPELVKIESDGRVASDYSSE